MKAAPADQVRLLDVAALDIRATQLDHKAKSLPERVTLAELDKQLPIAADAVALVTVQLADLDLDIARIDGEVEQVRARADKDRALLDAGTGSAQVLQNLQHELETLARRQGELEEAELEVLEQAETLREQLAGATVREADLRAERATVQSALDALLVDINAERAAVLQERAVIVESLPTDLIGLYEKVRTDVGGVGAAALHRKRCQGCQMEQTPTEINRFRAAPEDEVLRCEECRRILVRTSESGL